MPSSAFSAGWRRWEGQLFWYENEKRRPQRLKGEKPVKGGKPVNKEVKLENWRGETHTQQTKCPWSPLAWRLSLCMTLQFGLMTREDLSKHLHYLLTLKVDEVAERTELLQTTGLQYIATLRTPSKQKTRCLLPDLLVLYCQTFFKKCILCNL